MNWKDKDCSGCVFRVERECRRFPAFQQVVQGYEYVTHPFQVDPDFQFTGYQSACAEYAESLDKPQEPADYIV